MEIIKNLTGTALVLTPIGQLDTATAPELETVLQDSLNGIEDLTLDFEKVTYVSSSGLRVILHAQKIMNTQGRMKITHVNNDVKDVLDITGFTDILTIE